MFDKMRSRLDRRTFLMGSAVAGAFAATAAHAAPPQQYRRIACEEAFTTQEIIEASSIAAGGVPSMRSGPIAGSIIEPLLDLGEGRIADMDRSGVDIQILALTSPGVQHLEKDIALSLMPAVNDHLAAAIEAHPTRYAGLAVMAPQDPEATALELERAVRTLGLKGGVINSHTNGEYLDDQKFWPMLEAAEALGVPIYIHPREPGPAIDGVYLPGFIVGWGFAVETGTHILRLIGAGVFDRFPNLKVVIGHLGEMIPFVLNRIDNRYEFESGLFDRPRLARSPSEYFKSNIWVTTSGMNFPAPLRTTIEQIGIDRILFAADYPLESQEDAVNQIEATQLSSEEKAKIFDTNPTNVFGI